MPHSGCLGLAALAFLCVQIDTLQFLALRRKLSSRQVSNAEEGSRLGLDDACKKLAVQLPQPDRAMETIGALLQVRDNNAFAVMQAALAPGASQEVGRVAWGTVDMMCCSKASARLGPCLMPVLNCA